GPASHDCGWRPRSRRRPQRRRISGSADGPAVPPRRRRRRNLKEQPVRRTASRMLRASGTLGCPTGGKGGSIRYNWHPVEEHLRKPSGMAQPTAAMERILSELNPQQREAVVHGRGPLLIVAGAGTGKTTTLAHRVAQL